ncbi:MAG: LPS export ABC transporter periplasmic protein LptC [Steroidobacteraceae bacterium]
MIGRLVLLAALIALIAVLVEWRLFGGEEPVASAEVERPGYYLTGIQLEDFGVDGKPRLGLQAATAKEAPATGIVTLRAVAVDYHALEGQKWHLTSDEAQVPRGAHAVEFAGDVHMSGQSGNLPGVAELRTTRLTLDTTTERAGTRDPVTLAIGRHVMHARGMQVDLKAGSLKLESEVNGLFTP